MSHKNPSRIATKRRTYAPVFAALGDQTRLSLVAQLCRGEPCSISQLTRGHGVSRQAITKHLRVLEDAGIVRSIRSGRENRFAFHPDTMMDLRAYLDFVSGQWDRALSRLQSFVERQ
ncbi:MAG TPA: metalloregulator ArsR/SmtB family transcription factor [Candidatus Acidoferrales bacterium]|nr:metalloregulator ArsR/SmtB family transcription factor [Candidatus Acidoferrales bacterium]